MSFTTTTTKSSRRHSWHSPIFDPTILQTGLVPKQSRSASMPCPSVVPRKSALKRSPAYPEGNLDTASSVPKVRSLTPLMPDDRAKQTLLDDKKRPTLPTTHSSALKKISFRVLPIYFFIRSAAPIPIPPICLPPAHERRIASLLPYADLPAPAEWDEVSVIFESVSDSESVREPAEQTCQLPPILVPRRVRFLVPAPPDPEPEYEEPAWSDFMVVIHVHCAHRGSVPFATRLRY
ncbi:hypothetical protein C8R47DRAFT_1216976 [Mycena vitilis]|nr:hypothetical protein C8R47DRAFT_1216976 [Mycena vitilis]